MDLDQKIQDFWFNVKLVSKFEDDYYPVEVDIPDENIRKFFN